MASIGFHVHTDKENETPLHSQRPTDKSRRLLNAKSWQAFSSGNKLTQPTPRKALGSVNHQLPPASHGIKAPVEALFKSKAFVGDENLQAGHFKKKAKTKSSPSLHTGIKKSVSSKQYCKTKSPKVKSKSAVDPIPIIPDDKEYDSDEIFPHKDRLSNYVDKLLTWRPPCLFGYVPDSDSDTNDLDEGWNQVIHLNEIPAPDNFNEELDFGELPQDLSELLVDLPSISPVTEEYLPEDQYICEVPVINQSLDSSLHLGSLHIGIPDEDLVGDLGLESSQ